MIRTASLFTTAALVSLLVVAALMPEAEEPPESGTLFSFTDPRIDESSGLVALGPGSGDLVVTVNDSGDEARVFAVDPATGETVGVTRWDAEVEDVEALAPVGPVTGATEVWVADIGDNFRRRDEVVLYRVPVGRGDRDLDAAEVPTYRLVYPDGARDAETLLAHPTTGRLYVVSKGVLGGDVYRAPRRLRADVPHRLTAVRRAPGMLTDGAFLPDGRHLLLRSYDDAYLYRYPDLELVGDFPLPRQPQGEGLAVAQDGSVLLSTEGRRKAVLALGLPDRLVEATGTDEGEPEPSPSGWWERLPLGPLAPLGPAGVLGAAGALGVLLLVLLGLRARRRRAGAHDQGRTWGG